MNALVTGGAGYIGSSVSHYLLDKDHNVTIIDNLFFIFRDELFLSFFYFFSYICLFNSDPKIK